MEKPTPDSEILFQYEDPKYGVKSLLLISQIVNGAAKASIRYCSNLIIDDIRNEAKTMAYLNSISSPIIGGACIAIGCDSKHDHINEVTTNFFEQISFFLDSNVGVSIFHSQNLKQILGIEENWQKGIIKNLEISIPSKLFDERSNLVLSIELTDERFIIPNQHLKLGAIANAWSLMESIRHFFNFWGGTMNYKRLVIGDWNQNSAIASQYLTRHNVFVIAFHHHGKYYFNRQAWSEQELNSFFNSIEQAKEYEITEEKYFEYLSSNGAEIYISSSSSEINEKHINVLLNQGYELHLEQDFKQKTKFLEQIDSKVAIIPSFISLSGLERMFYTAGISENKPDDIELLIDISNMIEAALMKINQFNMKNTGIYQKSIELAEGMLK